MKMKNLCEQLYAKFCQDFNIWFNSGILQSFDK